MKLLGDQAHVMRLDENEKARGVVHVKGQRPQDTKHNRYSIIEVQRDMLI